MTNETREKANEIAKNIERLDDFIFFAERGHHAMKFILRGIRLIIKCCTGYYPLEEIVLTEEEKEKVIQVLKDEKNELTQRLNSL